MTYRDPVQAAARRLDHLRDRVSEREDRIDERLLEHLPPALAHALEELRRGTEQAPGELEEMRELERLLTNYLRALDKALDEAPVLDRLYNGLSRSFPSKLTPLRTSFLYPDVFEQAVQKARERVHGVVLAVDKSANLFDKATGYELRDYPYLVEATLRHEGAPMRLQVMSQCHYTQNWVVHRVDLLFVMGTTVRRSAPRVRVEPARFGNRLRELLRLRRDAKVGNKELDDAFFVDALDEDARRLLTPQVATSWLAFNKPVKDSLLVVEAGRAQLEWQGSEQQVREAAELLAAIRRLPPMPLYARRRSS